VTILPARASIGLLLVGIAVDIDSNPGQVVGVHADVGNDAGRPSLVAGAADNVAGTPDAVAGWDDDLNAELYARFTRDYPFYAATSRDLAERASLPGALLVVDLGGGTGATAAVLL
jgi:hypothetical protein